MKSRNPPQTTNCVPTKVQAHAIRVEPAHGPSFHWREVTFKMKILSVGNNLSDCDPVQVAPPKKTIVSLLSPVGFMKESLINQICNDNLVLSEAMMLAVDVSNLLIAIHGWSVLLVDIWFVCCASDRDTFSWAIRMKLSMYATRCCSDISHLHRLPMFYS